MDNGFFGKLFDLNNNENLNNNERAIDYKAFETTIGKNENISKEEEK